MKIIILLMILIIPILSAPQANSCIDIKPSPTSTPQATPTNDLGQIL